jgi:hypothetical protein
LLELALLGTVERPRSLLRRAQGRCRLSRDDLRDSHISYIAVNPPLTQLEAKRTRAAWAERLPLSHPVAGELFVIDPSFFNQPCKRFINNTALEATALETAPDLVNATGTTGKEAERRFVCLLTP